ncbi:SAM-dependent methyltransferase [Virgibacillus phasianinus]|uniref:SAM-dependent methyltransferase n=2 Tax=Virgibacillus phasianinus TaxID=2017483 RepID=A0A220U8H2_9BACI|nr:SAM-dependent methyltransferase [Virgibacillus phasianinus]
MNEKENVKRAFAKNSNAYVTSSTHSTGPDLPLLIDWLKPQSDMNALDVATGGGHVAKHLSKHVANIIASDLTKEMLNNTAKYLHSYTNIKYAVADAEELPFDNNTFDIVTCRIAAHHFPTPDKFIAEVCRVLKPDGKFMLIDNVAAEEQTLDNFVNKVEKMRDYSHVRSHTVTEWMALFDKNQLTILKQQSRKKTLPYKEWTDRTLMDDQAKHAVSFYLKNAPKRIRDYFQVTITGDEISSFIIDEWMVMCKK